MWSAPSSSGSGRRPFAICGRPGGSGWARRTPSRCVSRHWACSRLSRRSRRPPTANGSPSRTPDCPRIEEEVPMVPFHDRLDAGRQLAGMLMAYADRPDILVLALPRGGVPVAYEVAQALHAPLDVFLVRKLGVPGHEELAMGAIATGGILVLNDDVVRGLGIPADVIQAAAAREQQELERREHLYRGDHPPPEVRGR